MSGFERSMMLKQSPSRNQRSKGFKVKHAVQICVLLAIFIWLLYQVKHSHDKKAYEESSGKFSEKVQSGHEILKIGRKGFHPRVEETVLENETRGDEEEHEETRVEENEDEEYEQGEDLIDEQDDEREEGSEEQENEEKENHIEDASLSEDQDHGRVERNSQETREENYNRDDASSAVVHKIQTISTKIEKIRLRKVKEEEQDYAGAEEETGLPASSTTIEIEDGVQNESFNSSDSSFYQEDREDHADLVTLPVIEIGTSNSEDADE